MNKESYGIIHLNKSLLVAYFKGYATEHVTKSDLTPGWCMEPERFHTIKDKVQRWY